MKTVLTATSVTFICVWPWGVADALTMSVFSWADLREHFKNCFAEGFNNGLATGLD